MLRQNFQTRHGSLSNFGAVRWAVNIDKSIKNFTSVNSIADNNDIFSFGPDQQHHQNSLKF
jgi:hypothetical protein